MVSIFIPHLENLPERVQKVILHGSGSEEIDFYYERDGRKHFFRKPFEGVIPNMERRYRESEREDLDEEFGRYMSVVPCPSCDGARLKKEARHVLLGGMPIHNLTALSVSDAIRVHDEPSAWLAGHGDRA